MKISLIIVCLFLILCGCNPHTRYPWEVVKEGKVKNVEYMPSDCWGCDRKTIIYFEDGSTFVLLGLREIPSSHIKILQKYYLSGGKKQFCIYSSAYKIVND